MSNVVGKTFGATFVECRISLEFLVEKLYLICTRNILEQKLSLFWVSCSNKQTKHVFALAQMFLPFYFQLYLKKDFEVYVSTETSSQGMGGRVFPSFE